MTLATARDLALIVLAAQGCVLILVLGAGLFLATRGLGRGLGWLQGVGFPRLRHWTQLAAERTRFYSQKVTAPLLALETARYQAGFSLGLIVRLLRQRRRSP
ncbi:MAG: hypothetical protein N2383_04645 [Caldilineales bacterium]|nr:hypothetical protein [Caldilineales bacterium]